ncbi:MAG: hypothetical protein NVS3B20_10130 [Polyangiales bacterium]
MVALFDIDPSVASRALGSLGSHGSHGVVAAPTLGEAIEHADLVVVATPADAHLSVAMFAIEQGRHVLVEKPLAPNASDARHLVHHAALRNTALFVGFSERFNPAVTEASARLRLAALRAFEMVREGPPSPRRVNGFRGATARPRRDILTELAIHDLDLVSFLSQSKIAFMQARLEGSEEQDEVARIEVRTESGVHARIEVSWRARRRSRRLTIVEFDRRAQFDLLSPSPVAHTAQGTPALVAQAQAIISALRHRCSANASIPRLRDRRLVEGDEALPVLEAIDFARANIKSPVAHATNSPAASAAVTSVTWR